jgi:hypothetical protein
MPDLQQTEAPEFRDWSIAAVRLLQGVVYSDDAKTWDIVLRSRSSLETHFARLALMLVVDEPEGYAYLRQWQECEYPAGYENVPRLVRRSPLGYSPTLLCVLLRDELRRFEEDDLHNERCVVETSALFDQWRVFFPAGQDEVRQRKEFVGVLRKVEELGFIRKFADNPEAWEIRRILKSRLPVTELEALKQQLAATATTGTDGGGPGGGDSNG